MKKQPFNTDWVCNGIPVTLPHDAQIKEKRGPDVSDSGHGYFPGGIYVYEKKFTASEAWRGQTVFLEFEGVYRNCRIRLNDMEIGEHRYGYTPFTVPLADLRFGEENTLTVTVDNSELPNSRWYTGSGIYRPVWLYVGGKKHIKWRGVKVSTVSVDPARIWVETEATGGEIHIEVLDGERIVAEGKGQNAGIQIPEAKLWSDKSPN